MKKNLLLITLTIFFFKVSQAQTPIDGVLLDATNTQAKQPGAAAEVYSTTGGFLTPRMTQAQRDLIATNCTCTPTTGMLIYQTNNTPGYYYYNGSSWVLIASSSGSGFIENRAVDAVSATGQSASFDITGSGEIGTKLNLSGATGTILSSTDAGVQTIALSNDDITNANSLTFSDPGEGEGIIWNGTAAKIFVSPLDAGNADGYLRLINDGGIVFEPGAEDTETMTLETSGTVRLNTYTTNGIVRTISGNGTLSSTGGGIDLTTEVTGILPVANGGTGQSTQGWVDLTTNQTAAGAKTWSNQATFSAGLLSSNGTVGAPAIGFSTQPATGIYLAGANDWRVAIAGTWRFRVGAGYVQINGTVRPADGTAALPAHTFSGETDMGMWRAGTDLLAFSTAATERMRIDATGNVGIGTTGPISKLEVQGGDLNVSGQGRFKGWYSQGTGLAAEIGISSGQAYLYSYDRTGGSYQPINLSGSTVGIGHSGVNSDIFVTSSGSVGIGTTSPTGKIHIFAGGASGVGWSTGLNIGDATNYTGFIQDGGVSRWRNFGTGGYDWYSSGGTQRMALSDAGVLKLTSLAASSAVYTDGSSNLTTTAPGTGTLGFWTRSSTNLYPTNIADKIGINTASPATMLNVNLGAGNATYGTAAIRIGGTSNYASLELGIKGAYDGMISTYGNDLHIYAGNWGSTAMATEDHKLWFYTSKSGSTNWNTAKMVLNADGYVGIGTTSPGAILDVQGAKGVRIGNSTYDANLVFGNNATWKSGIRVYDNGVAEMRIWHTHTTGLISISTGYNGDQSTVLPTDGLFVKSNYVGIGTSAPGAKLELEGTSANWNQTTPGLAEGSIHLDPGVGTDHFGSAITWGASDASSGDNAQAGIYVRSDGSYGTKMYFGTTDSYAAGSKTRMYIGADGLVGIGTTSPVTNLQVTGSANSALTVSSTNYPTNYKTQLGAQSGAQGILVLGNNGTNEIRFGNTAAGGYGYIYVNNTADYSSAATGTLSTTFASSGNVGIGTTAPTEKLSVAGALTTANFQVKRDFATFNTTAGNNYPIHIKTNIPWSNIMYRIVVEGYNYGAAQPIFSEVVGYTYAPIPASITNGNAINHASGASISQYKSSDGYVVVKLSHGSSFYYAGFSVSAWLTNPAGNAFDIKALSIAQIAPCTHTISLYDSYGDGWHGNNFVYVYVNGSLVVNGGTLGAGYGPANYTFSASQGDAIQVTYSGGSWPGECYYDVTSGTGALLVDNWYPNSSGTWNGTGGCP